MDIIELALCHESKCYSALDNLMKKNNIMRKKIIIVMTNGEKAFENT